jgi:filamentous hemagglutinin
LVAKVPAKFADNTRLLDHFARHGRDVGATSAADYERLASDFLTGPLATGVLEKTRANGDIVRFDPATQLFGIIRPNGIIRTFFKPDPAVHGLASNLDYFNAQ